jgi:hypothetical protein
MTDILKYIKLGTNSKEWFNYDGTPLPIRPLSTYEMDEILEKIITEGITQQTFTSIYKIKFNLFNQKEKVEVSQKNYLEFFNYLNIIDYWMVFYSMKDYQEEEFSKPDYSEEFRDEFDDWREDTPKGYFIVKKMKYVHQLAKDIQYMTSQPLTALARVLKNKSGKTLASMVFKFHIPLANEAWKLTPLQETFLYYGDPSGPTLLESEKDLPGIKAGTMGDIAKQLMCLGFNL